MADTIRSLVELDALFADNVIAAITPQDVRDLMVSMMVHGEIGSGAQSSITLGTGWQPINLNVEGMVGRGITVDTLNQRLADIPVEMKAIVHCEVVFKGAAGADYEFAVWRNTHTAEPSMIDRMHRVLHVVTTTQTVAHAWSTSVQLEAGESLQLGVKADGQPFELLFGVLRVQRIGIE